MSPYLLWFYFYFYIHIKTNWYQLSMISYANTSNENSIRTNNNIFRLVIRKYVLWRDTYVQLFNSNMPFSKKLFTKNKTCSSIRWTINANLNNTYFSKIIATMIKNCIKHNKVNRNLQYSYFESLHNLIITKTSI